MSKTRITVNEDEQRLVDISRQLAQLRMKKRGFLEKVAALDKEIEAAETTLRGMVPAGQ